MQQRTAATEAGTNYLSVGSFRFWFAGQRWEWSDEVARMHGYEPGTVAPTTKLLLSHKHPDDRAHVQDLIEYALHSEESFSSRHRFMDEGGAVLGTAGYYLDLTDTFDETLPDLFKNRAAIEQAKGVLMYVYRVSAEQAFRVLQWRSQQTNVKLRALAKQLLAEVSTLMPPTAAIQSQFDHVLLTVHERIPAESGENAG